MTQPAERNVDLDVGMDSKDDTYLDTESFPPPRPQDSHIDSKPATPRQIRTYTWAFSATCYGVSRQSSLHHPILVDLAANRANVDYCRLERHSARRGRT